MIKTYSYKAKARTGQVLTGSIMAENEAAVAAYIRDKGYFVTNQSAEISIHYWCDVR